VPQHDRKERRETIVVLSEKLSIPLFFKSKMDGIGGTLCREVLDEGPEPCHFGLGMETSAGDVCAHPSGDRFYEVETATERAQHAVP